MSAVWLAGFEASAHADGHDEWRERSSQPKGVPDTFGRSTHAWWRLWARYG